MTNELSREQFISTMKSKMIDVTENAEAVVDIWDYVGALVDQKLINRLILEGNLIEKVYRNEDSTFDHILLPTEKIDSFIIVVIDLVKKNVTGHYLLNLNTEYGLDQ